MADAPPSQYPQTQVQRWNANIEALRAAKDVGHRGSRRNPGGSSRVGHTRRVCLHTRVPPQCLLHLAGSYRGDVGRSRHHGRVTGAPRPAGAGTRFLFRPVPDPPTPAPVGEARAHGRWTGHPFGGRAKPMCSASTHGGQATPTPLCGTPASSPRRLREVSTGEDPESPSSTCTTSGSPMRPALGTYVWAWFELPAPLPRRSQLESIEQRRRNPIALARGWQRRLDTDEVASRAELARELGVTGHM